MKRENKFVLINCSEFGLLTKVIWASHQKDKYSISLHLLNIKINLIRCQVLSA